MEKSNLRLTFLSSFPPRECGIATYTASLARVLDKLYLKKQSNVIAINEPDKEYRYSKRVIFQIEERNKKSYQKAAFFINQNKTEVLNLHHEYGLFGGEYGGYIIEFLKKIKKPTVVEMHSVLLGHPPKGYEVTQKILELSTKIIVMTKTAKKMLCQMFKIKPEKIVVIHHGTPDVRLERKEKAKRVFGFKDKIILSTFGLINRGKGIEYVLESLPKVIDKFPQVIYLIIGETHPVIRRKEGERYRKKLEKMVKKLKLEKNVKFINQYLGYRELVEYLEATDIYISHQLDPHQAVSGTLAYAVGCGKAIVATPTVYAKEILKNSRGVIVNFRDSEGLSKILLNLLKRGKWQNLSKKAYQFGRKMIWPRVAKEHLKVFERVKDEFKLS